METYYFSQFGDIRSDGLSRGWSDPQDIDGNPVKRTKQEYPYSYDPFVIWRKCEKLPKGTSAVYSDRLWEWDSKKFDRSWEECGGRGQRFDNAAPETVEKFLQLYYDNDKTLELMAIVEGANVSTGYPYWVFYFKGKK